MCFRSRLGELHTTVAVAAVHLTVRRVEERRRNEYGYVSLQRRQRAASTFTLALRYHLLGLRIRFEICFEEITISMTLDTRHLALGSDERFCGASACQRDENAQSRDRSQ
jgi:hypothetical protein